MSDIGHRDQSRRDGELEQLALPVARFAETFGVERTTVLARLARLLERRASFEQLLRRFDVRRRGARGGRSCGS